MSQNTAIKVYSTTWCAFCHQAKAYFKSLGLDYTDIDVEKDPTEAESMVKKTGQMGVPVIEIGEEVIIGFNKPKVDEVLKTSGLIK